MPLGLCAAAASDPGQRRVHDARASIIRAREDSTTHRLRRRRHRMFRRGLRPSLGTCVGARVASSAFAREISRPTVHAPTSSRVRVHRTRRVHARSTSFSRHARGVRDRRTAVTIRRSVGVRDGSETPTFHVRAAHRSTHRRISSRHPCDPPAWAIALVSRSSASRASVASACGVASTASRRRRRRVRRVRRVGAARVRDLGRIHVHSARDAHRARVDSLAHGRRARNVRHGDDRYAFIVAFDGRARRTRARASTRCASDDACATMHAR